MPAERKTIFGSVSEFVSQQSGLLDLLCVEARCARWNLSREQFAETLLRSAEKRFSGAPASPAEVGSYLKSLHLSDLALACACSEGIEGAWEFFVKQFRPGLRSAARAIVGASGSPDQTRAEELADSLYADLYGLNQDSGGRRKSLFEYFHGRSRLSTWLRAVLAQRHVDLLRAGRRNIPLTEDERASRAVPAQRTASPDDPDRRRYVALFDKAIEAALAVLAPREKMLLACYYVDRLTLAEIARIAGEHESTVSRRLDRLRRNLGEQVDHILRQPVATQDEGLPGTGLDSAQIELALQAALEDSALDLSRALYKDPGPPGAAQQAESAGEQVQDLDSKAF